MVTLITIMMVGGWIVSVYLAYVNANLKKSLKNLEHHIENLETLLIDRDGL